MAFLVQTYDATQIRQSFAGIALAQGAGQSGYAEGEFISVKFKPQFTTQKGTDGSLTRSATNDRECEVEINLIQGNSLNAALSALLYADISTPNGTGIGSYVLEDLQGVLLVSIPTAWIVQPADISLDLGAKGRKWSLHGLWDTLVL